MRRDAAGFRLYRFPVDQVFRKAQSDHVSLFDAGSAKKETLAELERLTAEIEEEIKDAE
jgi:hypothetical protein